MRPLIHSTIFLTSFFMTFYGFGQADSSVLRIVVSEVEEWKANEGETFKIKVGANGGSDLNYKFGFSSEQSSDMKMDGVGNFRWSVNFGIVSVFNSTRIVPITFFVHNESKEADSVVLEIIVLNKLNSDGGRPEKWRLISQIRLDGIYWMKETRSRSS